MCRIWFSCRAARSYFVSSPLEDEDVTNNFNNGSARFSWLRSGHDRSEPACPEPGLLLDSAFRVVLFLLWHVKMSSVKTVKRPVLKLNDWDKTAARKTVHPSTEHRSCQIIEFKKSVLTDLSTWAVLHFAPFKQHTQYVPSTATHCSVYQHLVHILHLYITVLHYFYWLNKKK